MSKTKLHLLTEVGCLLCDTLYDQSRVLTRDSPPVSNVASC
jgi:hypothetical protein